MTTPLGRGKDRRSLWRQVGVHSFIAAPATPARAKTAVSDAARRTEIEALMRVDGGKGYWRDPAGRERASAFRSAGARLLVGLQGDIVTVPP
jgi:hypothetical protein